MATYPDRGECLHLEVAKAVVSVELAVEVVAAVVVSMS